jgi:KDO2-lipid IV(A) lauroyltransferase
MRHTVLRRTRHLAEYIGLRAALAAADAFPAKVSARVARGLGRVAFALARGRRRIACENILTAGIAADEAGARRIARASFEHFAAMGVESMQTVSLFGREDWRGYVSMEGDAESLALLHDPAAGIVMTSAHLGNWELASSLLSRIKPLVAVARPMNNPHIDRFLASKTHRTGFETLPKSGRTGPMLVDALRRGRIVAILIDQHARQRGLMVDFFGKPASTHTSPARLHLATGAPIVPTFCVSVSPLHYRLHLAAPVRLTPGGDRQADMLAIMSELNGFVESWIRRYPGQYLWAHRRWKAKPAAGGEREEREQT